MNIWLLFILVSIIGGYLFEILASSLNIRALRSELPDEFFEIFKPDEYTKAQRYNKVTLRFQIISSTFTTATTLCFAIFGGFNTIDLFARGFGYSEILTGLVFIGCLALLSFLLNLPFSIYSVFVIEEQFGFNRTTIKTYLLDILKGTLLLLILGAPLLSMIFWFFLYAGDMAWIYCWAGVAGISFIIQFLAPILIMPLFNTYSPLANESLSDKIMSYAKKENFHVKGIFTMDGSKRSGKLNAFFTGFGRFRKIVFFDTLLEKLNENEIVAVLAHEMGHFKLRHTWKMMFISIGQTGVMFFFLSFILNNTGLFEAFHMMHISVYASLIFFVFLYAPLNLIVSIFFNSLSRKHEFEADTFAAITTQSAEHLISGLKTLSKENLTNLTPHPFYVFLHSTHPPILKRINALRRYNSSSYERSPHVSPLASKLQ